MAFCPIDPGRHEEFVTFLDAGMRPDDSPTRTADDFPVALAPANTPGMWGIRDAKGFAAGLAYLVRPFITTAGTIPVAAIGSVVTRPDRRGEGLSRDLQSAVLDHLAAQGVPLAVLWTDQPELYAGRGFVAAGWEFHVDLAGADLAGSQPAEVEIRSFEPADTDAVAALYHEHTLRTVREVSDHALLYGMPGTRGLVAEVDGRLTAYAFCGKGADFPGYVAEWGGATNHVLAVLVAVREAGLAGRILVPAGGEDLLEALLSRGAPAAVAPCGLWAVLDSDRLTDLTGLATIGDDAVSWLGLPGEDGLPRAGLLQVAVWGLDSV